MLSAILTIFCFGIRKRASAMITVRLHNGIQFFPARCVNISLSADICRFQQTVAYKTAWRKYTFQKITIGLFGVVSFLLLILSGHSGIRKYAWYMFAGAVVISLICLFLFILTVSKKFSDLIMKLARKLVKQKSRLYPLLNKAQVSIDYLQEQGRIVWKDKRLFLTVVGLDFFKFACWYAIPGIFFAGSYSVTVATCLGLTAVCNMVGCVMLAPSGVGTLDFVFALFFACVIPDGDAVAAALVIYRLFTWIVPFVIGLVPALAVRKRDEK